MATEHFFDESSEQSAVKTAIVSKYFDAWASVMISQIKWIDLNTGVLFCQDRFACRCEGLPEQGIVAIEAGLLK